MMPRDKASLLHDFAYAETKMFLFPTSKFTTFPFLDKRMTAASLLTRALCPPALPIDLLSRCPIRELSSLCHLQSSVNPHVLLVPLKSPNQSPNPITVAFSPPLTEILRGSPPHVRSQDHSPQWVRNLTRSTTTGVFPGELWPESGCLKHSHTGLLVYLPCFCPNLGVEWLPCW